MEEKTNYKNMDKKTIKILIINNKIINKKIITKKINIIIEVIEEMIIKNGTIMVKTNLINKIIIYNKINKTIHKTIKIIIKKFNKMDLIIKINLEFKINRDMKMNFKIKKMEIKNLKFNKTIYKLEQNFSKIIIKKIIIIIFLIETIF